MKDLFKNNSPFFLPSVLIILLILSCNPSLQKKNTEPEKKTVNTESKRKIAEKIPLEFAFSGEAADCLMKNNLQKQSQDSSHSLNEPVKQIPPKKESKTDSLFNEMLAKSAQTEKKLKTVQNSGQLIYQRISPEEQAEKTEKIQESGAAVEMSVLSPEKEIPQPPPAPKMKTAKLENTGSNQEYQRMVEKLQNDSEPVHIIIGNGRQYWISILVSHLFQPGSANYNKALKWIVIHNDKFKTIFDLDMVRAGEELLLPSKKVIFKS